MEHSQTLKRIDSSHLDKAPCTQDLLGQGKYVQRCQTSYCRLGPLFPRNQPDQLSKQKRRQTLQRLIVSVIAGKKPYYAALF